jgi:predicted NAD/FAD-dependent oxidoreductase
MNAASVAVVGAGLAGLACARALHEAGVPVRVFESQRAPGGRLATRRFAAASFDHGAQYLTAGDPGFRSLLERAAAAGCAETWQPKWPQRNGGEALWVGGPAWRRLRATSPTSTSSTTRIALRGGRRGWTLLDDTARLSDYRRSRCASGAGGCLATGCTPSAARVRMVPMAPCWAAMVAFDEPLHGVADAGFTGDPLLAWYARNSSKPGREPREAFVLHASPGWSRVEFDQPPQNVQQALLDRFSEHVGHPAACTVADAYRWRHARVEEPLGEACLLDRDAGIGFCGDWCLEARAEAAWRSGAALGARLGQAQGAAASGKIRGSR